MKGVTEALTRLPPHLCCLQDGFSERRTRYEDDV
jgi:hypothetical protein